MNTETQSKNKVCPKCDLPNDTLHWQLLCSRWVCVACATNRQAEQQRLDAKFNRLNIHQESFDKRIIKTQKQSNKPDSV